MYSTRGTKKCKHNQLALKIGRPKELSHLAGKKCDTQSTACAPARPEPQKPRKTGRRRRGGATQFTPHTPCVNARSVHSICLLAIYFLFIIVCPLLGYTYSTYTKKAIWNFFKLG